MDEQMIDRQQQQYQRTVDSGVWLGKQIVRILATLKRLSTQPFAGSSPPRSTSQPIRSLSPPGS